MIVVVMVVARGGGDGSGSGGGGGGCGDASSSSLLPATVRRRWWIGRAGEDGRERGRGELSVERIEILDLLLGDAEGRNGGRGRG